ncbi:MAG: hypothetical protein H0V70_25835 [Ktedonobacteraceae bacterium]|nr:hypothetical protein [Ktedonobacteraceae bacterium]
MTDKISVGQCIRLLNYVDRFDDFLAKPGMTGVVTSVKEDAIVAKMNQPLSDNPDYQAAIEAEWGNCIHWYPIDIPPDPERGFEGLSMTALEDFLSDCELIDCLPA